MKKLTSLTLLGLSVFLMGCENKQEKLEIPKEEELKDLPYYSYLKEDNPIIVITVKDYGEMMIELFPDVAKVTVDNLLSYIKTNAYKNSSFHRVIESFMIQGGIVENTMPSIIGEFDANGISNPLPHDRGVISMARTSVNNSATSQFFIMHAKSPHLDGNYASFGGLLKGFDVLDAIATTETNFSDAPLKTIVIENITAYLRGYKGLSE